MRDWKSPCWTFSSGIVFNKQLHCKRCESPRLPLMWPGFDSGPVSYTGWVCSWFSPCSRVFLCMGSLLFFPPQKPTSPDSNSNRIQDPHENQLRLMRNFFVISLHKRTGRGEGGQLGGCSPPPPPAGKTILLFGGKTDVPFGQTTSKMYQISMAWIVKCYQVRKQSLKTTTARTHARDKTQPWR